MADVEKLEVRVHGDRSLPVLVYLPGLHGDWTLIGRFRKAVSGRLCFAEVTYPRTLTWSLEDYAAEVEEGLRRQGLNSGWLLGESFGSQIAWPLLARGVFQACGLVLAGGFVRHPARGWIRWGEGMPGGWPLSLFVRALFGFSRIWRLRPDQEAARAVAEFLARRTVRDRQAACHRLRLIAGNDPRDIARRALVPVFGIWGLWDMIVPWLPVRKWLRRNCPAFRACRIVRRSDHNVLSNGCAEAAEQILRWIFAVQACEKLR